MFDDAKIRDLPLSRKPLLNPPKSCREFSAAFMRRVTRVCACAYAYNYKRWQGSPSRRTHVCSMTSCTRALAKVPSGLSELPDHERMSGRSGFGSFQREQQMNPLTDSKSFAGIFSGRNPKTVPYSVWEFFRNPFTESVQGYRRKSPGGIRADSRRLPAVSENPLIFAPSNECITI